jgi:uncharacterized membrane protein YjjP (DUF1212 family)
MRAATTAARDGSPPPELPEFLLELGRLLVTAGDAISDVDHRLRRVAARWGAHDVQLMVLPKSIVLAAGAGERARLAKVGDEEGLRLDQVTAVFDVARDAERGSLTPERGLQALRAIPGMENRYSVAASIAGQVVITLGIALVLRPSDPAIALYLGLGLLVALMRHMAGKLPGFDALLPVLAAGSVSVVAFLVKGAEYDATSVQALIPPLVLLLPGALLTMATIDLAAGEVVTGASRLIAGFMQLALLAFGLFAGAALVGVAPAAETVELPAAAWWTPWLGVLVFAAGTALMRSVPAATMPWVLLVLVAAFGAQLLGEALFGARLSGFLGGLVAAPLAIVLERFRRAPPAFVSFLPAFWLLVPGSVGLVGVAQLVGDNPTSGVAGFVDAMAAIIAIALGVLVGIRLLRVSELTLRSGRFARRS